MQTFTRWLTLGSLGSGGCAEGQSQLACAFQSKGSGPRASLALDSFTWLTGQPRERHVSSPLYLLATERHQPSSLQRLGSPSPLECPFDANLVLPPCYLTPGLDTRGGPPLKGNSAQVAMRMDIWRMRGPVETRPHGHPLTDQLSGQWGGPEASGPSLQRDWSHFFLTGVILLTTATSLGKRLWPAKLWVAWTAVRVLIACCALRWALRGVGKGGHPT